MSVTSAREMAELMLRSSTPAANEKVLMYLERLAPGELPPTVNDWGETQSERDRQSAHYAMMKEMKKHENDEPPANWGFMPETETKSKPPEPIQKKKEPSHARHESHDSASSYGKLLPKGGSQVNVPHWTTWQPTWKQQNGSQTLGTPQVGHEMLTTPSAAKIALPESVISQYDINLESPTASNNNPSRAPSQASPPKARSKADSRIGAAAKYRTVPSEKGTAYPPLPASIQGEGNLWSPMSNHSQLLPPNSPLRVHSRSPSVSPSDSQSNAKYRQTAASPKAKPRSVVHPAERAFSPYRNGPTAEDLLHAARPASPTKSATVRSPSKAPSAAPSATPKAPSAISLSKEKGLKEPSVRAQSPLDDHLEPNEEKMVQDAINSRRTSYAAPSILEPDVAHSHFHDMDLCILLHQMDDFNTHEVVKKALRKAVRQRVKKLGLKYDSESIRQYRKSFHDHDPAVHLDENYNPETSQWPGDMPDWARMLMDGLSLVHERFDGLDDQIRHLSPAQAHLEQARKALSAVSEIQTNPYEQQTTPRAQTIQLDPQTTGTGMGSIYPVTDDQYAVSTKTRSDLNHHHHDEMYDEYDDDGYPVDGRTTPVPSQPPKSQSGTGTHTPVTPVRIATTEEKDSPGHQFLEEELYKLRIKGGGSQSGQSHKTWEVGEVDRDEFEEHHEPELLVDDREFNEIPVFDDAPVPPPKEDSLFAQQPQPWQRIHQRLLNWAIIWPTSELDQALNSTTRGYQVDEVALTIWSMQAYKRYVRSKMTDAPAGQPDRLFVPPNMADAISTAVFNGRHGDACGMLQDLWKPFGFEGLPRLIVVLAKHRSDPNHWVVHRFSLPEGALTTYDSYPERTLPDGRPLGWWFAIRVAWPGAVNRSPDHLMQKMVRLHRPMQLGIDNSVAAAGIWRNVLMASRAERSVDLERLRDLINTEVKNLRTRKIQGKLSIIPTAGGWADDGPWS